MELYDLESDLREEHDVAAEHPDIVRKLTRLMEKSHTEPENPKFRF
jgi:arylsulfatase